MSGGFFVGRPSESVSGALYGSEGACEACEACERVLFIVYFTVFQSVNTGCEGVKEK